MKIIAPLIRYYDLFFQSDQGNSVIKSFNTNENLLFKAVRKGEVTTDVQASKLLYDGNPSGQAYAKFKQAFYDKLIKMSINLELSESNEYLLKKFKLLREFHSIRLLSNLSATQLTVNLEKKVLIRAERMKMYDIASIICHNLSSQYKILEKKDKLGTFYWDKYLHFKKLEEVRIYAKNQYGDVVKFARKKHINDELSESARIKADELIKIIQLENIHAYRYYFQLRYVEHMLKGDHKMVIDSNIKAIEYFSTYSKNFDANETLRLQIAISYFNLGEHTKAVSYLDENVNPLAKRWLVQVALRARAYFGVGEFSRASQFMGGIIRHPTFKEGRTIFQEQVWLFKYFADLMVGIEKGEAINTRQIKNNLTRIRVDKKGKNIPILFADIINELLKHGLQYIYKEQEKLDIYYKSHVKPSKNKRAEIFMKFLMALPHYRYDKKTFESKLAKFLIAFRENPMNDVVQPDNEVVRYEMIVSRILDYFCPSVDNEFKNINDLIKIEEVV